ncbi:MAG: type II toxin-antitoxin system PemK/MazF family toxin [Runella sp.]
MARYQQGDVVIVNFPFTDVSQTKRRPALVISNDLVNQTGDYLLVQITSMTKNDGLSLFISNTDYKTDPLPLASFVRVHKVFLLNESLIVRKQTAVTSSFIQRLIDAINALLQ